MSLEKNKENMLKVLDIMLDENIDYQTRLVAYEYLQDGCEDIVEEMMRRSITLDGDTSKMLLETMARYKGHEEIFLLLVSNLYKGEDVALFAKLIGGYENEKGIEILKTFVDGYEPNYYEYQEIKAAIEQLGGTFELNQDFSDDPLYRCVKGLDEEEPKSLYQQIQESRNLLDEKNADEGDDNDDSSI